MRMLNCVLGPKWMSRTYQAFGPSVNDANKQETDWEPLFRILYVEIPE